MLEGLCGDNASVVPFLVKVDLYGIFPPFFCRCRDERFNGRTSIRIGEMKCLFGELAPGVTVGRIVQAKHFAVARNPLRKKLQWIFVVAEERRRYDVDDVDVGMSQHRGETEPCRIGLSCVPTRERGVPRNRYRGQELRRALRGSRPLMLRLVKDSLELGD